MPTYGGTPASQPAPGTTATTTPTGGGGVTNNYYTVVGDTVDPATAEQAGIVELATAQEATLGTDTTRAMTPALVRSVLPLAATATLAGIVELATTAETATGTDVTRAVTPAGLAAKLATHGGDVEVAIDGESGAVTLNWALGNIFDIQITGATIGPFTHTNITQTRKGTIRLKNASGGAVTVTWTGINVVAGTDTSMTTGEVWCAPLVAFAEGDVYMSPLAAAVTTTAPSTPSAPTLTAGNGQISAVWSAPSDGGSAISSYDVRHRVDPAGGWTETNLATLSVTIGGLTNGTAYDVAVRANNAIGSSAWSTEATATPVGTSRSWWQRPTRTIYTPTGTGVSRTATNNATLLSALAASGPGDVITLSSGEYGTFRWDSASGHPSGTSGQYITIQAASGATCVFTGTGTANNTDAVRVRNVDYWRLSGLEITGAQFNFRVFGAGWGEVMHCRVHDAGHANINVKYFDSSTPSHNILFEGCDVYSSGRILTGTEPYGEGFYLGTWTPIWADQTNNIEIRWCDIYDTIGDCVDIKSGCSNINVHHNRMHDSDVPQGSVITHTQADSAGPTDPAGATEKPIYIHHNRIWNIGFGGKTQGSAYGVTCHLGGEYIYNNLMWSFADFTSTSNTRAINIRGNSRSSTHPIHVYNNTCWVNDDYSEFWDGGSLLQTHPTVTKWNNVSGVGGLGTAATSSGAFVGTVPAQVGVQGTAGGDSTNKDEGKNFVPASATAVAATTSTVPADDLTSIARPQGARSDIGALEFI